MATQAIQQDKGRRSRESDGNPGAQRHSPDSHDRHGNHRDSSEAQGAKQTVQSAMGSSLVRTMILPGVVGLVFGIAAAGLYWHFSGSGQSGSRDDSSSPSSQSSGSGQSSRSSKNADTSEGVDSSEGSDSSEVSDLGKKARKSERADSSKGSDSGGGTGSSESSSGEGELQQVESAWKSALKEVRQAQEAESAARHAAEETKAILEFFRKTLLSAGRPDNSLTATFWSEGAKGKDVTLQKAVDVTAARVAEAFPDRPLSEASVREMLGWAYLSLSDAPKAVIEYERAFALREAVQGDNHVDTAACRNQLAVAYRLANRFDDASRLFDRNPNTPAYAAALAVRGAMLLMERKPAQAELKLRASLTVRQKVQPDDWSTFDTMSMLGEALLQQRKFAEAEPLLISGYEGLKQRKDTMPPQELPHVTKALERLVNLYQAWGQQDKVLKWRQELDSTSRTEKL